MDSLSLIIIIAVFVILYFLKEKFSAFFQQEEIKLPFKRKDFLLNIPERKFFENLQKNIPNDYVIFPQILMSTIVSVKSSKKEFWKYQNKM